MLWWLIKAYDFANRNHKELESFKKILDSRKVPHDILSHYEKSYVAFYQWINEIGVDEKIIKKFDELFKFD
jgi:hypothetical protein